MKGSEGKKTGLCLFSFPFFKRRHGREELERHRKWQSQQNWCLISSGGAVSYAELWAINSWTCRCISPSSGVYIALLNLCVPFHHSEACWKRECSVLQCVFHQYVFCLLLKVCPQHHTKTHWNTAKSIISASSSKYILRCSSLCAPSSANWIIKSVYWGGSYWTDTLIHMCTKKRRAGVRWRLLFHLICYCKWLFC